MWEAFEAQADRQRRNPLDSWLRPEIERVAAEVDATSVFPNDGPPFVPVQDWAARAEPVYRSPIGIMIHPGFRSLACLPRRIAVPRQDRIAVPSGGAEPV